MEAVGSYARGLLTVIDNTGLTIVIRSLKLCFIRIGYLRSLVRAVDP